MLKIKALLIAGVLCATGFTGDSSLSASVVYISPYNDYYSYGYYPYYSYNPYAYYYPYTYRYNPYWGRGYGRGGYWRGYHHHRRWHR